MDLKSNYRRMTEFCNVMSFVLIDERRRTSEYLCSLQIESSVDRYGTFPLWIIFLRMAMDKECRL
jgi:hypothetical protein